MAITLDGTTGISSVDASASSPSVRGADSNSGIFYSADAIKFSTGGTQRAIIDNNGLSSAGHILQVVKGPTLSARISTTSTTYADTGTTVNITPSATSSKIWVIASGDTWIQGTGYNAMGMLKLMRDSTDLMEVYNTYDSENSSFAARLGQPHCMQVLDSPGTTSQITYKVQYALSSTNYSSQFYYPSKDTSGFYPNCQITVIEVAG